MLSSTLNSIKVEAKSSAHLLLESPESDIILINMQIISMHIPWRSSSPVKINSCKKKPRSLGEIIITSFGQILADLSKKDKNDFFTGKDFIENKVLIPISHRELNKKSLDEILCVTNTINDNIISSRIFSSSSSFARTRTKNFINWTSAISRLIRHFFKKDRADLTFLDISESKRSDKLILHRNLMKLWIFIILAAVFSG